MLRICGMATTLRLNNQFWDILAELAGHDGITSHHLIGKLYEEVMDHRGEVIEGAAIEWLRRNRAALPR